MKKILITFIGFGMLFSTQSCNKVCAPWYEGDDCLTISRDKFLGDYLGYEIVNGTITDDSVNFKIEANGSDLSALLVTYEASEQISANLISSDEFTVSSTVLANLDTISGNGMLNGDSLHLHLTSKQNGGGAINVHYNLKK